VNHTYTPNFSKLMSDCELNYHRIMRLLSDLDDEDQWCFGLEGSNEQIRQVCIQVVERSKYTTTIAVSQDSWLQGAPNPTFSVRLYHDARVAEVLGFQRNRHLRERYPYPNEKMCQPDEKAQLNAFLGEWLDFCFKAGRALLQIK